MSTGLGCPHAETDPDFLGLMVAFQARSGRRIDFVTINDPTSPTDTPEEFVALLQATADAAGGPARESGETAAQPGAARRDQGGLDCRARVGSDAPHDAVQRLPHMDRHRPRADTFGKFTFVPVDPPVQSSHGRGSKQLTEDWRRGRPQGR